MKSPKAYWGDPGLAVFLSGYYQPEELRRAREFGGYFETLIYHHLCVLARLMTPRASMDPIDRVIYILISIKIFWPPAQSQPGQHA